MSKLLSSRELFNQLTHGFITNVLLESEVEEPVFNRIYYQIHKVLHQKREGVDILLRIRLAAGQLTPTVPESVFYSYFTKEEVSSEEIKSSTLADITEFVEMQCVGQQAATRWNELEKQLQVSIKRFLYDRFVEKA